MIQYLIFLFKQHEAHLNALIQTIFQSLRLNDTGGTDGTYGEIVALILSKNFNIATFDTMVHLVNQINAALQPIPNDAPYFSEEPISLAVEMAQADVPQIVAKLKEYSLRKARLNREWPLHQRKPSYEQLHAMRYADAVIKETLRLFPLVAFASSRTCCKTTEIGSYIIEKGTTVQADVFSIHRDPHIFGPDPDDFRPERWLNENEEDSAKQHRLSWMGFGTGPRTCVGMRFAYMEMKTALIYLVRKFKIFPNTEKSELKLVGTSVLAPESVFVRLQRHS
ncbi:cytochrome p450 domain-containing protein [Ditylenchus destructor]|nr:cytochrome p450 domain-containing protein [Ditylenchus destructor]